MEGREMLSLGSIVAWAGLAVTVIASMLAGARSMGALRRQVDTHESKLKEVDDSLREVSRAMLPLAERVGQHEDRLRDAELAQAAMRTAVAEATKETAVLIEQNRWISASLERIEKRVNTLGS
mgnify:CR=1 FL=1